MTLEKNPDYMKVVEAGMRSMSVQPDLELLAGVSIALFHNSTTLFGNGNMNSSIAWWVHDDINAAARANDMIAMLAFNLARNMIQNLGLDLATRIWVDQLNAAVKAVQENPS